MQGTELIVKVILCFVSGGFHISTKNSCPATAGKYVLVCGQDIVRIYLTLFEGGLSCVKN